MPRGVYKRKKLKASKVTAKSKRRKWRVETAAEPFGVTEEVVADSLSPRDIEEEDLRRHVRQWYDEAPSLAERQARKAALMGVMYGADKDTIQSLLNKYGSTIHRWSSGQPNLSNIPKEAFNPDSLFVKPPLVDNPISPAHYQRHPSGVECITITEHFNFNRGNAIKYIWRADEKGSTLENLRKAQWYLNREIERLEKEAVK